MSSVVYFKFKANVKTDSINFDGSSISVKDLKTGIRAKCCLYSTEFDLKLEDTNGKAYTKDDELIPKYSSIIVRRIPRILTEAAKKKVPYVLYAINFLSTSEDASWRDLQKNAGADNQTHKHLNLAQSDLPEDEKIKIMMERSSEIYNESNFTVKAKPYGMPPATYTCHKCNLPGHWIHNCPGVRDKTGKLMDAKMFKRPTGIPQDFLLEVEAGTPGAYLGKSGKYMVPIKDAEAYALGKKDKRPFSVEENPPYIVSERKPPKQFICPLCNKLFVDAVLVSCCGSTYCNECILGHVFDSQVLGSHKCPNCSAVLTDHESSVFENALVRSLIRDWIANETKLSTSLENPDEMMFSLDSERINSRRVLKPRQAMNDNQIQMKSAEVTPSTNRNVSSINQFTAAVSTTTTTNSQTIDSTNNNSSSGTTTSNLVRKIDPVLKEQNNNNKINSSSKTDCVTLIKQNISDRNGCVLNSVDDDDDKNKNNNFSLLETGEHVLPPVSNAVLTGFSVNDITTTSATITSSTVANIINNNNNAISFPLKSINSNSVLPTVLQNGNLLNTLYGMQLDSRLLSSANNLHSFSAGGRLIGHPEWSNDSVTDLTEASLTQGAGLIDPTLLIQTNSNNASSATAAMFGLASSLGHSLITDGSDCRGGVSGSIYHPRLIETIDGRKMLSKEEFYRLKNEVLHSSRRRHHHHHRHRSRTRSPVHRSGSGNSGHGSVVYDNKRTRSRADSVRRRYGLDRVIVDQRRQLKREQELMSRRKQRFMMDEDRRDGRRRSHESPAHSPVNYSRRARDDHLLHIRDGSWNRKEGAIEERRLARNNYDRLPLVHDYGSDSEPEPMGPRNPSAPRTLEDWDSVGERPDSRRIILLKPKTNNIELTQPCSTKSDPDRGMEGVRIDDQDLAEQEEQEEEDVKVKKNKKKKKHKHKHRHHKKHKKQSDLCADEKEESQEELIDECTNTIIEREFTKREKRRKRKSSENISNPITDSVHPNDDNDELIIADQSTNSTSQFTPNEIVYYDDRLEKEENDVIFD